MHKCRMRQTLHNTLNPAKPHSRNVAFIQLQNQGVQNTIRDKSSLECQS